MAISTERVTASRHARSDHEKGTSRLSAWSLWRNVATLALTLIAGSRDGINRAPTFLEWQAPAPSHRYHHLFPFILVILAIDEVFGHHVRDLEGFISLRFWRSSDYSCS
ncbi:hypothetical protein FA15DRAFT_347212 [Coprinopsis marcescibilis]|uniref:Uncharacterized protein n=1 Tax=Coprinopsis marcescibilis TaxID=230819 RepID=A0A5C3LA63_COPMA|nr:hypothetical protein FA15DRAFT_347212 [Coprinopsis marcescibilis]